MSDNARFPIKHLDPRRDLEHHIIELFKKKQNERVHNEHVELIRVFPSPGSASQADLTPIPKNNNEAMEVNAQSEYLYKYVPGEDGEAMVVRVKKPEQPKEVRQVNERRAEPDVEAAAPEEEEKSCWFSCSWEKWTIIVLSTLMIVSLGALFYKGKVPIH